MQTAEKSAPVTNPILKFRQKPTRGNAIKAKCAECVGCTADHIEPGFRSVIRDCSDMNCSLRDFRPYQSKTESE